jgi:hypothetical protein
MSLICPDYLLFLDLFSVSLVVSWNEGPAVHGEDTFVSVQWRIIDWWLRVLLTDRFPKRKHTCKGERVPPKQCQRKLDRLAVTMATSLNYLCWKIQGPFISSPSFTCLLIGSKYASLFCILRFVRCLPFYLQVVGSTFLCNSLFVAWFLTFMYGITINFSYYYCV